MEPLFPLFAPAARKLPDLHPDEAKRLQKTASAQPKWFLVQLIERVLETKATYQVFLETLDGELRQMWELLLLHPTLTLAEMERELDRTLHREEPMRGSQMRYYYVPIRYHPFMINTQYDGVIFTRGRVELPFTSPRQFLFKLRPEIRRLALPHFETPDTHRPQTLPDPPEAEHTLHTETEFLELFPRLKGVEEKGMFRRTKAGRTARTGLPKVAKLTNITPFFAGRVPNRYKLLRTYLTATLLHRWRNFLDQPAEEFLTAGLAFERDGASVLAEPLLPQLLFHLDTLTKMKREAFDHRAEAKVFGVGQWLEPGAWYSVDSLVRALAMELRGEIFTYRNVKFYLHDPAEGINWRQVSIDSVRYVVGPFLRGVLFTLGSLGVFDLNYATPDPAPTPSVDPFGTLNAVRLTPLGAYAYGKTTTYAAPATTQTTFTLDPELLLVNVKGDAQTARLLLNEYATELAPYRFQLDHATFLKGLATRADFLEKMNRFQRTVHVDDLPDAWLRWRSQTAARFNVFTEESDARVLNFNADNRAVRELLVRDPVLRTLVRRVEGHGVVVARADYAKFTRRLRALGYVV